ncbi:McrB family protein [Chloroflexota bacterium]
MSAYVIRLGSRGGEEEVGILLDQSQTSITVSGIYQYEYELTSGDLVFFYLGGEQAAITWTQGLRAVGRVLRPPYDKGYDGSRNYKLDVDKLYLLGRSIEPRESKIHPRLANRLWDVPYLGARHFQNQAIGKIWEDDQIRAVFELILEKEPQSEVVLRGQLPTDILPQPSHQAQTSDESPVVSLLTWSKQVVLYGPPGTGKTYLARLVARHFDEHQIVQFHPSYSYEDFVGGIRPVLSRGTTSGTAAQLSPTPIYHIEEYVGLFQDICRRAQAEPEKRFLLIIDEINRGNLSSIFGELILAIEPDKRGIPIPLSYLKESTLIVPENLYLIATMNSADRSIALVDVALRRRFSFYRMTPDYSMLNESIGPDNLNLGVLLRSLNTKIAGQLGEDFELGHSYLLSKRHEGQPISDIDELRLAWFHTIIPLLEEYFRGDLTRVADMVGDAFFISTENTQHGIASRKPRYGISDEELLQALGILTS